MSATVLFAYCACSIIVTVILVKFCKRNRHQHYEVPARDITKGHRWVMTHMFPHPTYCVISGQHIFDGAFCDSCGLCVDDHNIKIANMKFSCKNLARQSTNYRHHWVKGNLPLCSKCYICNEQCGVLPQLCDFRCCWCQRTIHEHCLADRDETCDLGQFRDLIVPPNCVQLKLVGWKGRKHLVVDSVRIPPIPKWSPMIVIANRKSGNEDGEKILQKFRSCLNPAQVVDLHDLPPDAGLEWCHLVPDIPCRVIVAGGDGTVCWVLNAIENLKLNPAPHLCILPLGTGNDLSRVTGWGDGHVGDVNVKHIMQKIEEAECAKLDRWKVSIVSRKRMGISLPRRTKVRPSYYRLADTRRQYCYLLSPGETQMPSLLRHVLRKDMDRNNGIPWRIINSTLIRTKERVSREGYRALSYVKSSYMSRVVMMNNYASIGVDARVTLDFHNHRQSQPSLFGNRFMNKLELDGVPVELPAVEGIVVLNISSWGGGCRPWGTDLTPNARPQKFDDGLLEVMGLYSSFHIAQLQVGLAEPLRLGQARKVKIMLMSGRFPVQVDGEPWNQIPGDITITHSSQASILVHRASQI